MNKPAGRLHFLDAIRAFAILMMLQGHFVHALLEDVYRDRDNLAYTIWEYMRGMTAPTFFTITGFIFTYLLIKQKTSGLENPRVIKGVKRAVKVIFWGYLLRLSLFALAEGTLNPSFFYVDVLQCIGTSLLLLIGVYLISCRTNQCAFKYGVLGIGIIVFLLQPIYNTCVLAYLPDTIANYFTNKNGSVFTLFPWFGYVCFGSFIATMFLKYKDHKMFYVYGILISLCLGVFLMYYSSAVLMDIYHFTKIGVFKAVAYNNFLFIRLGNVFVLFSVFMLLRNYLQHPLINKIGGKTLSIYIIHFFVLYGSWFGLGLSRFFYHDLSPVEAVIGALLFMIGICALVLNYYRYEDDIKTKLYPLWEQVYAKVTANTYFLDLISGVKSNLVRTVRFFKHALKG